MRMSPVAVQQLITRMEARRIEDLERVAKMSDEAIERLREELQGVLLTNWLLVKRAGGEVTITTAELESRAGRLQMMRDPEKHTWRLIALDPEPIGDSVTDDTAAVQATVTE